MRLGIRRRDRRSEPVDEATAPAAAPEAPPEPEGTPNGSSGDALTDEAPTTKAAEPQPAPGNGSDTGVPDPPAETAPARPRGRGGLGRRVAEVAVDPATPSRDELERQAAEELRQAGAPAFDLLMATVPEASSPEEARAALEQRMGEPLEDPDAKVRVPGPYSGDTMVYYQVRRHFGESRMMPSIRQRPWSPESLEARQRAAKDQRPGA